jgi:hypothetical protein
VRPETVAPNRLKEVVVMAALTRKAWVAKIAAAWKNAIDAVFQTGDVLLEAKRDLSHGSFLQMIRKDLPFGPRTAQMLMVIAKDKRLRPNAKPASYLPASWTVLHVLNQLPDQEFSAALTAGIISPKMTRADARAIASPRRISVVVNHRTERVVSPVYVKSAPTIVPFYKSAPPTSPVQSPDATKVAEALVAKHGVRACVEIATAISRDPEVHRALLQLTEQDFAAASISSSRQR